jgi:hypothetical protein
VKRGKNEKRERREVPRGEIEEKDRGERKEREK